MSQNTLFLSTGESGMLPLLLFLSLILSITLLISGADNPKRSLPLKSRPLFGLSLLIGLQFLFVCIPFGKALFSSEEILLERWIDISIMQMIPWSGAVMLIPIVRCGAILVPFRLLCIPLSAAILADVASVVMFLCGAMWGAAKYPLFLFVFFFYLFYVFRWVRYHKSGKESFLILSNLYFLFSLMELLLFFIIYSTLLMDIGASVRWRLLLLYTFCLNGWMLFWFSRGERWLTESRKMYTVPQKKKIGYVLSEPEVFYDTYGIKERLLSLFEKEKPYLSPDLTLPVLAKMLGTNQSYLSKAINNSFNLSYSEFVNKSRVDEAVRMFKEDKSISLDELRSRCGFRHTSSFNNAFKWHTGCTPGEWCRKVKKGEEVYGIVENAD